VCAVESVTIGGDLVQPIDLGAQDAQPEHDLSNEFFIGHLSCQSSNHECKLLASLVIPKLTEEDPQMSIKRRGTMGAAAAALGAAGVLAAFAAGGQHASAAPQRQLTLDSQLTAIQFFTPTG